MASPLVLILALLGLVAAFLYTWDEAGEFRVRGFEGYQYLGAAALLGGLLRSSRRRVRVVLAQIIWISTAVLATWWTTGDTVSYGSIGLLLWVLATWRAVTWLYATALTVAAATLAFAAVNTEASAVVPAAGGVLVVILAWLASANRTLGAKSAALAQDLALADQERQWWAERAELARELHDTVGHHVTAMVVQSEAGLAATDDGSRAVLGVIGDTGRRALAELDHLVLGLRQEDTSTGGRHRLSEIDALADPLRGQGVQVDVDVARLELPMSVEHALHRITQELLTNVQRHARAAHVQVALQQQRDEVVLSVTDDGIGFDPEAAAASQRSGLRGIGERVLALHGTWDLSSRTSTCTSPRTSSPVPNSGTVAVIRIPGGGLR